MKRLLFAILLSFHISVTNAQEQPIRVATEATSKVTAVTGKENSVNKNVNSVNNTSLTTNFSSYGAKSGNTTTTYAPGAITTNEAAIPAYTVNKLYTAPNISAPALAYGGSDTCLGSVSGGLSVLGFGITGGNTYVDKNCVILKNSARLQQMGLNNAALALLATNPENEAALRLSSPAVYYNIIADRVANLEAEIQARQENRELTYEYEKLLEEAKIILRTTELRLAKEKASK